MEFFGDYHLHTIASDGRASVAAHIRAAEKRNIKEIAITDHSFSTLAFHLTEKKFDAQTETIASLGGHGVKVLQGVEGNLIGDRLDVPHSVIRRCDVLLVGFHRFVSLRKAAGNGEFLRINGFGSLKKREKLICRNTEAYLSVMENYPVDVIAHLGHRALVDFTKLCECAARRNVYLELNAKHFDALEDGIAEAVASGVKFIVGSDAHDTRKLGRFGEVERFIRENSIPVERIYGINGNRPIFKDKREWQYGSDV